MSAVFRFRSWLGNLVKHPKFGSASFIVKVFAFASEASFHVRILRVTSRSPFQTHQFSFASHPIQPKTSALALSVSKP